MAKQEVEVKHKDYFNTLFSYRLEGKLEVTVFKTSLQFIKNIS